MRKVILTSIILLLAASSAFAGSVANGLVKAVAMDRAYNQHKVFVTIVGAKSEFPECHTNTSWTYVLPLDSQLDMAIFSTLLTAQKEGKSVIAEGRGKCNVHGSIETLEYIKYQTP